VFDLHGFGPTLVAGTWLTIKLAVFALLVGLCLGLLGAGAKLSRFKTLRILADFFTTLVRGVPELVQILFIYFGGTIIINSAASWLGHSGYIDVNPFAAGVAALGINFGAYATEVFRGAILAIPRGQTEAARALGMHGPLIFRRIILPQVWRFALPGLGNLFLVLQKITALVSVIGLAELMRNATMATNYTKKPFTFYMTAALIYLSLTIITMAGLHLLEKRASRGVKRV